MIQHYFDQIAAEEKLTQQYLHLTANETVMSKTSRHFMDSPLGDLYFMGGGDQDGIVDFQPFTFRGSAPIHELVTAAEDAAKDMLGAKAINFGCLSGVHAMMCAILSTTDPGDTVMSVDLEHGGHFATKGIIERAGRKQITTSYNFETLNFNVNEIASKFRETQAKALYLDVSFYINPHNLKEIRQAIGHEAIIIYDASHTLGLIMGGRFQDPFQEGADVICANTHKTLPGPQKGIIAFRDQELGDRANQIINSGLYSSTHTTSMIALAVAILEIEKFGAAFADQIIKNSNSLGEELVELGHEVRKANTGKFSENHQVHLMTHKLGNYRELFKCLVDNNISVNFDNSLGGRMYIRLGTQTVTRRGMKDNEMARIAQYLDNVFRGIDTADEVKKLVAEFGNIEYSFDKEMGY